MGKDDKFPHLIILFTPNGGDSEAEIILHMQKIKLLYSLFFCLMVQAVYADDISTIVPTTDRITISDLTVEPGSADTYSFTVSLDGDASTEHYYTAYDIQLTFPEGLDVALSSKGAYRVSMTKPSLYPYSIEEEENEDGEIEEVYLETSKQP